MTTYAWSALASGSAIAFDPSSDVLNFDVPAISASLVGLDVSNAASSVFSFGGKTVTLNASPLALTASSVVFAGGGMLLIGDNSPGTANDGASNTLNGGTGDDLLVGGSFSNNIRGASTAAAGTLGNSYSYDPTISADGRYVAFYSTASNLVPGDTNNVDDVFVKDLQTGAIARVSTAADGTQGNNASSGASISADGRYVAFTSQASNLVSGDANTASDVFVKDLTTGVITRMSTASDNSEANLSSDSAVISANGRVVVFLSNASNLVAGDTNGTGFNLGAPDVFAKDLQTGAVTRVNTAVDGTQATVIPTITTSRPAVSADGRFVAFSSESTNLVPGDTNEGADTFVKDLQTGAITRANTAANGAQDNTVFEGLFKFATTEPAISADGRFVAFSSNGNGLVTGDSNGRTDIFVKDLQTGAVTRVSTAADGTQGNGDSHDPDISADGRYVAFYSTASNLVPGDTNNVTDVFVKDLQTGAIVRASMANDGTAGNSFSVRLALVADGSYVVFESDASNLLPGDTNQARDIFVAALPVGDLLRGGPGGDTYIVSSVLDVIVENPGEGVDTVRSSVNFVLGAALENLVLTGISPTNGTGNALTNNLSGNSAANVLDGGAGDDTMTGGPGDDTYLVDSAGDVVAENASEGMDTVRSSVTYTLPSNVENLVLTGAGAINGTTNALANTLTGNSAANVLDGGAGNDTLTGDSGDDTLIGADGTDILEGGVGNDLGDGGVGADQISGGAGDDVLFGDAGDDMLRGGSGDDLLMGERGEAALAGGSDSLYGGAGNDQLDGGPGVDLLYGEDWGDVIDGDEGSDMVMGGTAPDILRGSAASIAGPATVGGDLFVYTQLDDAGDRIFGFDTTPVLGENDGIDLRPLFDLLGYSGTNPRGDGWLNVTDSSTPNDAVVWIDPNGGGNSYIPLLTLIGVATATLTDIFFLFQ